MSGVRVLVGTRKGGFVLTADGKRSRWDVSGPHFAGWEIYHVKGSPADPKRLKGVGLIPCQDPEVAAKELELAGVCFIQKPFSMDALANTIRGVLDGFLP